MKLTLLLLTFLSVSLAPAHLLYGQPDISETLVNPVSFQFEDLDLTVKEYFHEVLKSDTACCREVDYFFSIKYDGTGTVTHANALSDANDCTTRLLSEAAYKIRWNARRNISSKTIYLELNFDPTCKN